MAFEIIWTRQAARGFDKIINYLQENWTDKEVITFVTEADRFFETLITHPEILQMSNRKQNIHRGPLNSLTIITYRIKPKSKQIQLLNIRGARQRPIK